VDLAVGADEGPGQAEFETERHGRSFQLVTIEYGKRPAGPPSVSEPVEIKEHEAVL